MSDSVQNRRLGSGTWLTIGSPVIAELAAECGFDWVLIDLEHGFTTDAGLLSCLQAVKSEKVTVIVRVPGLDPATIARVLDWGAAGVMVPHINNAEEAVACVRAMRYPPRGDRGFSSSVRAFRFGLNASADVPPPLFLAQIESVAGVQHCRDVAEVDGVDMLFVGPADLRLALSVAPEIGIGFEDALRVVGEAAGASGKQAGILVRNMEDVSKLRTLGYSCLALGSDLAFLREGFAAALVAGLAGDS